MKFKKFLYFIIITALTCLIAVSVSSCKEAAKTKKAAGLLEKTSDSTAQQPGESDAEKVTTTTAWELPEHLQKLIDDADRLFAEGLYAEAVSAYRTARGNLMSVSSIDPEITNKIIEKMNVNADKAKFITDTARLHYGNAMQLIYEKRIEEALSELEEALEIYPKYQDAHDSLDSLKTLHALK